MNETDLAGLAIDDPIDLLERDLFTVTTGAESMTTSLAGLLERLSHDESTELGLLMPHQQHALHAFAVQLAALVAARAGGHRLERSAEEWRQALRQLAGGPEPFQLVVPDLTKPAFMQPPVPEKTLARFKPIETPDSLDLLVLAKNHDVKMTRIRHPRVEHWVFALISLQTQQGFSGRDNYGIARMNGGFGNRPGFGMAPSLAWAPRFRRDVAAALAARPGLLDGRFRADGVGLVWTEPWSGTESLPFDALDPFFVEICRRVRIARSEDGLVVSMTSTKVPRLEGKAFQGDTGDIWTPVDRERGAALTLPGTGLPYSRLAEILFQEDWRRPAALEVRPEDGASPLALARALVRGQGKTEGLHERVVTVPERSRSLLLSADGRASLGRLAKHRVELARALRLKDLKPALCALLQGGLDDLRLDDKGGDSILDAVEDAIDAEFFPRLFADAAVEDEEEVETSFQAWLVDLGRDALERAIGSLPTPTARRERAIAGATARFWGGARKNFPQSSAASPSRKEDSDERAHA